MITVHFVIDVWYLMRCLFMLWCDGGLLVVGGLIGYIIACNEREGGTPKE